MNTARIVDQVRTSRSSRQTADRALLGAEDTADEEQRNKLLLDALTQLSRAVAAIEQALMAAVDQ